jgi:undecaprenyl-diphosphatase
VTIAAPADGRIAGDDDRYGWTRGAAVIDDPSRVDLPSVVAVEVQESPPATAERSPSDVLRLVVATAVLVAAWLVQVLIGDRAVDSTRDLFRGLDTLPSWLVAAVVLTAWGGAVVLFVGGGALAVLYRNWRALAVAALGAAIALALAALLGWAHEPTAPPVTDVGGAAGWFADHPGVTELLVAATAAVATAAGPWVSRWWRRQAWGVVIALVVTRAIVSPVELSSLRALLVGWFAGALAVVVVGTPPQRPRGAAIADGLRAVGVPVRCLQQASLDARGSTPWFAVGDDGRRLFVKALGRDERGADLLFRLYRRLSPRDLGDERGYLSLRRAVEHEALLALAARDLGVQTPRVVALAAAEPSAFVLVYEAIDGRSLDRLDPGEIDDRLLRSIWVQVRLLRTRGLAHRDLRLANVFVADDGEVWMIDFGFSELAASDTLLAADIAELLAATSLPVGVERAVAAAVAELGPDVVATAAARLQPWALSGATRTNLKERPGLLDELRTRVVGLAETRPGSAGSAA